MWRCNRVTGTRLVFNRLAVTALPQEKEDNIVPRAKLNIESFVNDLARSALADTQPANQESGTLESVLRGLAIELWSDAAGGLFIVADEDDARRLGEPRGKVYTAAELRRVVQIEDPAIVREIHEWKRTFNGRWRQ
jgi:hypothetical protein